MFFKNMSRATCMAIGVANLKSCSLTLVRRNSDQCLKATATTATAQTTNDTDKIKKSVYISQSTDIYTNLALEHWFFKNMDFTHNHVMMLWRNDPCVVIGRHQNPWVEANCDELKENGIKLARRNSGGGTVYHDLGNLNMTFFTPHNFYNRRYNLEIISRALFREWSLKADVNKREDIVVRNNFKVSGTAAKLTRTNSYHHCTLLVDVSKAQLAKALVKKDLGIETNATKSIPSPVLNLKDENKHITVEKLMSAIGWEYLRTPAHELIDGGLSYASQQNGFKYINPSEGWFPGLNAIRDEFASWDWVYGKTPKFSSNIYLTPLNTAKEQLKLSMTIEAGRIDDIVLQIPPGLSTMGFHGDAEVYVADSKSMKGQKFSEASVDSLRKLAPDQSQMKKDVSAKLMAESVN